MWPAGAVTLPNYRDIVACCVDDALERGLDTLALTNENWQVVLYEGTIRLVQGDITPAAASSAAGAKFPPPVWTPSRKRALSSSSDLYQLPDFSVASPDPLSAGISTPVPKKPRWDPLPPNTPSPFPARTPASGHPVLSLIPKVQSALMDLLSSKTPQSGSLVAQLDVPSVAQLYFLLGVDPQAVVQSMEQDKPPSLPFDGPACPRCLPESIFHAVGTKCPLSKTVKFSAEPTPGHTSAAVQPADRLAKQKPTSYASAAASAVAGSRPPASAGAKGPSGVTRSLRRCTRQGTKTTKVIFRPPQGSGLPPSVPAIKTAFQGFHPPLKDAEFTLRQDVVLSFGEVVSATDHERAVARLTPLFAGGKGEVVNRGTSAMLKFPLVPTHLPDGSAVTADQLHNWIVAHPRWGAATFIQRARFVTPTGKNLGLSATVFVEISDDRASSTARRLLQTDISFGGAIRRTQPWSLKRPTTQCGICLKWGHSSHRCRSKTVWCARCAGNHDTVSHDVIVKTTAPLPLLCVNCKGTHSAVSRECPFFLARFDEKKMMKLQAERRTRITTKRADKREKKKREVAEVRGMVLD